MKIGFISYRLAGNDGVSLVGKHWKNILERIRGHEVVFVAGEVSGRGVVVPEFHFLGNRSQVIHDSVVKNGKELADVEGEIELIKAEIYEDLVHVQRREKFDRLVVANCMSIPVQFSASGAIDKLIREFEIPTVAWCPDFWWERERFVNLNRDDFLDKNFVPTDNRYIKYVTINSLAKKNLYDKKNIESDVVPDTFDFNCKLNEFDDFNRCFRSDFGINEEDIIFLQATRVIPRKKVEHAMELVKKLSDPRVVLVIAGQGSDEGYGYYYNLVNLAKQLQIRCVFINERISDERRIDQHGRRVYTLWDAFVNADWMTYPSEIEGFGNQFLEGVYFKKPIFVNRYPVYKSDIEPLGFECVNMNGVVDENVMSQMKGWLSDIEKVKKAVTHNFELAKRNFSFEVTAEKLKKLGF